MHQEIAVTAKVVGPRIRISTREQEACSRGYMIGSNAFIGAIREIENNGLHIIGTLVFESSRICPFTNRTMMNGRVCWWVHGAEASFIVDSTQIVGSGDEFIPSSTASSSDSDRPTYQEVQSTQHLPSALMEQENMRVLWNPAPQVVQEVDIHGCKYTNTSILT